MGRTRATVVLLWIGAFLFSLSTLVFFNDHFGRISPARQIARYGEWPFRDYFDPGYFLTELASALMQKLLGDNLLGEALLTTAFEATGAVLVFLLALRLSKSHVASIAAACLALLLLPRAYDYDKVLFYPLGLFVCWRYVRHPDARRLWAVAAVLVAAALFRYDNGVYVAAAAVVAMSVVHAGDWRQFGRRLVLLALAAACLVAPFAVLVQRNGGLVDAIDQVVGYGRRETARTRLPSQRFSFQSARSAAADNAPAPGDTEPALREVWTDGNADVFLAWFCRLLPLVAAGLLLYRLFRGADPLRRSDSWGLTPREEIAQVASLVAMCVCLNVFILRAPVGARVGGMAGPIAVLSVWVAACVWRAPSIALRRAGRVTVALLLLLTVGAISLSADWKGRLTPDMTRPAYLQGTLRAFSATPPSLEHQSNFAIVGIVRYLRECTAPTDRVLVTWFAPDIYFFAQRGFAAGIVALFGGHWSEPRFQARSVENLRAHSVPIVITRTGDEAFERDYPQVARHLGEHYVVGGRSDFGDDHIGQDGYTVLVRRDRTASRTFANTSLPCFW